MKFIRFLLILFTVFFLIECKKDESVVCDPEESIIWEEDERFNFKNRIQYNSYSTSENLFFVGTDVFSHIHEQAGEENITLNHFGINYDQDYKMPIDSNYFALANNDWVLVLETGSPFLGQTPIISMNEIDESFYSFGFPIFRNSNAIQFYDHDKCFIPYIYSTPQDSYGLRVLQTTIESTNGLISIPDTIIHDLSIHSFPLSLRSFYNLGDKLFLTDAESVFLLNDQQEFEMVNDFFFESMFYSNGKYFGVKYDELYASDNGLDWQLFSEVSLALRSLNYSYFNGNTVGYYLNSLWVVNYTDEGLEFAELENVGIEGKQITSISYFNNNVYLSSFSGVFKKSEDDFYNYK